MAENYSFSIILEPQEEGGFTVLVPALPEVVTEGDTEQEALANAEEATAVPYRARSQVEAQSVKACGQPFGRGVDVQTPQVIAR